MCLTVSQIGLIADIIGTLLLFKFGLPSHIEDVNSASIVGPTTDAEKLEAINRNRKIYIGAYIGLSLLLVGFVLQFIGRFK
jgi:hypothetical protein